jgi:homoserine O-acetyltransferase/O-succinyltransferase
MNIFHNFFFRSHRTDQSFRFNSLNRFFFVLVLIMGFSLFENTALAQNPNFPKPVEGDWVVRDFKFSTGDVLPELNLHYTTIGEPTGEPVLVLHGTTGSGIGMTNPAFGGELFGPGQPLDASKYFIILPDAIGTGKSSKPSDGLRAKFPQYNYDDMVTAQYRLVKEHLGIKRLRLIVGNSMGGMQVWMWAQKYPDMMDVAVPMASLPTEMNSRNWMMRRFLVDSIRNDPEWMGGNYTKQPASWQFASVFYAIATNGGSQAINKAASTREKADQIVYARLKAPMVGDANDHLYQWASSADYNPSAGLERITATLLAINSADDERNPPENGVLEREIKRVKNGKMLLIPGTESTAGHGTTAQAKFWKKELAELLQTAPKGN